MKAQRAVLKRTNTHLSFIFTFVILIYTIFIIIAHWIELDWIGLYFEHANKIK